MRPENKREVVIPWGAGSYRFRTRWEAALVKWIMRRWTGWTSWTFLDPEETARALKPAAGERQRKKIK